MKEILLKVEDIEIPNNGTVTLILHPNRDVYLGTVIKDVKIGTAVEIPPHEELIERKKLIEDSLKAEAFLPNNEIVEWFQQKISSAPTVLEASE